MYQLSAIVSILRTSIVFSIIIVSQKYTYCHYIVIPEKKFTFV